MSDLCITVYVSSAYSNLVHVLLDTRIDNYSRIRVTNLLILKVVLKSRVSDDSNQVWRIAMSLT